METATRPVPIDMEKVKDDFLAWNARQPVPMPICAHCGMGFDESNRGYLYDAWCGNCELTLMVNFVRRMIARWGRAGTKARLRALARRRPTPSTAAIKAAALRRLKRSEAATAAAVKSTV